MRKVIDPCVALPVGELPAEARLGWHDLLQYLTHYHRNFRGHAHKECEQVLIYMLGACRALRDDCLWQRELTLDWPSLGIHMPSMIWGTQYRCSGDAVLPVFASRPYAADHMGSYDEFLTALRR